MFRKDYFKTYTMSNTVSLNWYSSEEFKQERENAEKVLERMKDLEKKYKKTRKKIVEKTLCGERIKYIKK